jgi:hypothetical protein
MTGPYPPGGPPDTEATQRLPVQPGPYPGPPTAGPQQLPFQQPYADAWAATGQQYPSAPPLPAGPPPRRGPATGTVVALVLAGVVLLGLIGGGVALISNRSATPTDRAAPLDTVPVPTPPVVPTYPGLPNSEVAVSLPAVIDGHRQINNQYAQQLVGGLRRQLQTNPAFSSDADVGIYGDSGEALPAFLVAASTTDLDPELTLAGLALGMQQSAGAEPIDFKEQSPGPLGGSMRCAQSGQQFTVCLWGVEGAFGINIVYGEAIGDAAATTVRVRQAVETHS